MKVLICVLDGKYLDEVLKKVKKLASDNDNWIILNIASYDMYYLNKTLEDESLDYLYEKAVEYGAMVKVIRSNDIFRSLIEYIEKEDIKNVFIEDRREFRLLHALDSYVNEGKKDIKYTFIDI